MSALKMADWSVLTDWLLTKSLNEEAIQRTKRRRVNATYAHCDAALIGPRTTVFPAIRVIAVGMAGAVAPLTAAILGSVDRRHTGSASGLNSAVARTGGMVVLGAAGPALVCALVSFCECIFSDRRWCLGKMNVGSAI
jgi:hypothetical protein